MPKVVIRLPNPQPARDAKGKPLPAPRVNREAMFADLRRHLEPQLRRRYGPEVELVLASGASGEIRLEGAFPEKGVQVRGFIGELLEQAMESLDPSDYVVD